MLRQILRVALLTNRSRLVVDGDEVVDGFRLLLGVTNGECVSGYL